MQLFCPACQTPFTGVSRCPRCNGLLLMPDEAAYLTTGPDPAPPRPTKPTPAGRLTVGLLVAFGAYLGLRKLVSAWAAYQSADPDAWARTEEAQAAVFAVQAAAAACGALIGGSGRSRGVWLGAGVGLAFGVLLAGAEVLSGGGVDPLALVPPLVLAVVGAIAGAVAGWVWAGVPELDMPAPISRRESSIELTGVVTPPKGRPTAWLKVLVGAAVVAIGVVAADPARRAAEKETKGALRVTSVGQARFMSSQMAALVVLVGAAAAAAGTGAGVRHGVLAGVFGAAGMAGLAAASGKLPVPAGYFVELLNLDASQGATPLTLGVAGVGLAAAGAVGGWLGGTLFLPLAPAHLRGRRMRGGMV
jgi:hypothetical protein